MKIMEQSISGVTKLMRDWAGGLAIWLICGVLELRLPEKSDSISVLFAY